MPNTSSDARWALALDVGSSSVRAQLYDEHGVAAAAAPAAQVPVRWRTDPPGAMETDAGALVHAALTAIDGGVRAARAAGLTIAAVGVDTFWHGVMGVDEAGRALTSLHAWGDTRARDDARALRARVDADDAHARTGCFLHESYPAARLVWLRRTRGDTFPRATWLSIGEHLGERLFGIRRTSPSMASGTGLMDIRACRWDAELLAACGVTAARLPEISDEPLRGLRPEFARRWPELAGVPWFPALGDGACANVGSGAERPGTLALTVGTSAAVRVLRTGPAQVPRDLWLYRLDADRTVAGRALSNAGNTLAWLRQTLLLPPAERLEAELAALASAPPPPLEIVPVLLGERPPLSERGEVATIAGMAMSTTPVEIWRAWLWALAARIAEAVAVVERETGPAEEIVASGGALHASPAFRAIVERALGRPLPLRGAHGDETARGAALLALARLRP